jgi:membrane peptidoglycan carboxypeptidase
VRQQTVRLEKLHFAANTPFQTTLKQSAGQGEQVMAPEVAAAVRGALSDVVDAGTARRLQGGFTKTDGSPLAMGGKTGTGDNRMVTLSAGGHRVASRAVNRTATFVFFLGDSHFGTLTAFVPGRQAADFSFTSSLPIQVLRGMAPLLQPYLIPGDETPQAERQVIAAESVPAHPGGEQVNFLKTTSAQHQQE